MNITDINQQDIEDIDEIEFGEKDSKNLEIIEKKGSILSVDLNYEKWSNVFFPIYDKTSVVDFYEVRDTRVLFADRELKIPGHIQIRPGKDMRIFTHKTYEVYLACCRIWKEMDNSSEIVTVSFSQIAKYMGIVRPNQKELDSILYELQVLSRTTITWYEMYKTKDGEISSGTDWAIFEHFHWDERDKSERLDRFRGACVEFKFANHIFENVLNNVTSPVNLLSSRRPSTPLAKMYLSRLDSILHGRNEHQNTARKIIRDFDINPAIYKYPSDRKRMCTSLVKQLNGVETSVEGVFIKAEMQEAKQAFGEPKDYKCVFTKTGKPLKKQKSKPKKAGKEMPILNDQLHDQVALQEHMTDLFSLEKPTALMIKFSKVYRYEIINGACAEYERMAKNPHIKIDKPLALFSTIVHQQAHLMGAEWIKDCGANCSNRPGGQLF